MRNGITYENTSGEGGMPTGGWVKGTGIDIKWQDGPLGRGSDRQPPNGAFVEDILHAAQVRLEFYQQSSFACEENTNALQCIADALLWCEARTRKREERGVEGTHQE